MILSDSQQVSGECGVCRGFGERLGVGEDKGTCADCGGTGTMPAMGVKSRANGRLGGKPRSVPSKAKPKADKQPTTRKSKVRLLEPTDWVAEAKAKDVARRKRDPLKLKAYRDKYRAKLTQSLGAKKRTASRIRETSKIVAKKHAKASSTKRLVAVGLHNTPWYGKRGEGGRGTYVRVRLSEDERSQIRAKSHANHMSVSHYMRQCALQVELSPLVGKGGYSEKA